MADRVQVDPKGFAIYGSGQWTIPEGYAALKFMKGGLGSNQIDPNARLCMASAVTGFLATYGVDEPAGCYDDLDACDVLITWGNNPAEMHPVLFSRVIDRRSRGQKVEIIDIGTRRTRTTEHSQHYLEFRPHTDLAIANGIALHGAAILAPAARVRILHRQQLEIFLPVRALFFERRRAVAHLDPLDRAFAQAALPGARQKEFW